MQMNFDRGYFIKKFLKIPERKWVIGRFSHYKRGEGTLHCALGHCGQKDHIKTTDESKALRKIARSIITTNDTMRWKRHKFENPRSAVLCRLIEGLKV